MRPIPLALALALIAPAALSQPQKPPPMPEAFVCRGNEPFWSLTLEGPRARLERLGAPAAALAGERQRADWMRPRTDVWRGRATGDAGETFVVVTEQPCADTMADRRSAWRALLSPPGEGPRFGCCTPQRVDATARPRDDWSALLIDLWPAVEVCRARAPVGAVVVKAWPMNRGLAGTRWRGPDGERLDCVADLGTGRVDSASPVRGGDPLPGEGDPLFAPGPARGAEACTRAEPVARGGAVVGTLLYRTCR